jgi:predicted GNAT family acetyltransferase
MTDLNIPDEAVKLAAEQIRAVAAACCQEAALAANVAGSTEDWMGEAEAALEAAAPLIIAEARRQWETEQLDRLRAEVHDISNARHIYVQRSVDRFVDRNYGNVSEQEITNRYQRGVDRWNADHPALLALWGRFNTLAEAAKAAGQ